MEEAPGIANPNTTASSLFCLCIRKLAFSWDRLRLHELRHGLPLPLFTPIAKLLEDIENLGLFLHTDKIQRLPENCFILNPDSRQLDIEKTVLALEPFISKLEFFDLCSKLALDQPSERVYKTMSESDQDKLEDMDAREPVVWCRALELSPRRAILHYDEIALSCAASGYLPALERSLLKVREGEDTALLQRCALSAILNGHFNVANAIRMENFSSAFHYFFPDGHPSPSFIADLLDEKKLKPEVGGQIFDELIDWLSKLDVQWLIRAIKREPNIPPYVRQRLEWKYRECVDRREYPS